MRSRPQESPARNLKPLSQGALGRKVALVAGRTEVMLAALLAEAPVGMESARPPLLMEAMRYTALGGGKRLRPFIAVETARMFGAAGAGPLRAGAALELVHCYSLVHDDLPAMDNDDMRRGKPTLHKAHDEAMAILAGDGLLTLAFDVLADPRTARSAESRIALVRILAQGAGVGGMVGGQLLDLAAEGRYPATLAGGTPDEGVIRIQSMKTGALILAAAAMGAVLGGAAPAERLAVETYARALGLAFQIRDDLLDVEGDAAAVGKATGKDAAAGKATFLSLHGIDGARDYLNRVTRTAKDALRPFGARAATLAALPDFNAIRKS